MVNERRVRHLVNQPDAIAPRSVDAGLEGAARAFVPDASALTPVGNRRQVRVDAPSGSWVVRRWRAGATEGRIRFVHDLLRAARAAGIETVPEVLLAPDGAEALIRDGTIYDAQRWLPGAPLARFGPERGPNEDLVNLPSSLADTDLSQLIETVAWLHTASEPLARAQDAPTVPIAAVAAAVLDAWERARLRLRPAAPRTPAIQRWIRASERALRPAVRDLAAAPEVYGGASVVCHGDLWPAHALWQRSPQSDGVRRLTGIVDWADAARGSPLLDLAQIVGRFGGWTARTAEDAIGVYVAARRLGPDERRLLPAVAVLDLVAEAGWLLSIAQDQEGRGGTPSSALQAATESVVSSLEHAAEVAVRGDRPSKPVCRAWVHRPRPNVPGPRSGGNPSSRTAATDGPSDRRRRPTRGSDRPRYPHPPGSSAAGR